MKELPTVLIVDDHPINLKLAAEVLKEEYRLLIADNGMKAIKATKEKKPDLILLDIMMPEMSGIQVAKTIKENPDTREIPIIFLTAKNQPEDTVEAFMAGGVDYLTKPFQKLELLQRIKTHIQLSRQKNELFQTSLELRQLNEEKNRLFSMVAHDMRNFVGGSLELMKMTKDKLESMDKSTLNEYITAVVDNLNKTTTLMNELLAWSRKQSHTLSFNPEYFMLKPEVEKNIGNYDTLAGGKSIALHNEINEDFKVYGDKAMINTILRNLIHNAIKYTGNGGKVTVKSFNESAYNFISVSDTGVGIPEENLEAIFEDDFNSTADTLGKKGSAIGLKICKNYVKKHHGNIYAENNPDGGSKFEFYMPDRPIT